MCFRGEMTKGVSTCVLEEITKGVSMCVLEEITKEVSICVLWDFHLILYKIIELVGGTDITML